jgi:hypothetical protein
VAKPKKTTKTIERIDVLSNTRTWLDFMNNDAVLISPEKDSYRKRLGLTMLTWAQQETSLELVDFALEMKMRRQNLSDWADKYPDFREVYDTVKLMIGSRRRKGALTRKFDKDVVFKDDHIYDPERHELNQYWNNMKKDVAAAESKPAIVLDNLVTESGERIYPKKHEPEPKPD